jgi:hypothetical protein
VFQRHAVADLVDLYRQDVVPPRPLAAIRMKTVLLVEATRPAVLLSYPAREEAVTGGSGMTERRSHQGLSRTGPGDVLSHIEAAQLRGSCWDVRIGARQHVRVADDSSGPLRDEDRRAVGSSASPWAKSAVVSSTDRVASSASVRRSR